MSRKTKITLVKLFIALAWAIFATIMSVLYLVPTSPALGASLVAFNSLALCSIGLPQPSFTHV